MRACATSGHYGEIPARVHMIWKMIKQNRLQLQDHLIKNDQNHLICKVVLHMQNEETFKPRLGSQGSTERHQVVDM